MAGPEHLKTFSPRPQWLRKKLGYPALFIGSLLAKIKVKGRWHLPKEGPYIIAANHFSYIDPTFFKYAIRKPINFLAASDQTIDWYFMWAPLLYGFIPIDRTNLAPSTIKKAKKILKNGEILGIFPEGSSTSDSLRKAKNGAVFLSTVEKAPIVPMAIYGAETAWEDLFRGVRPRVTINIGKPFGPFDVKGTKNERISKIETIGEELITRIGALLPEDKRGVCFGDTRLLGFQKENGFFPQAHRPDLVL
ncbi:MAG: 1-acyl-sn-glycerol-3-phosphate acyltransferase [Candidatus Marinimicrobia bacterium]|jgi:1-acyl-sn-glycerol-3-phosphate acyltransferase|nr:1-acyl-sn-glycerol-3-phosphate acyltransferase [Candidatus Neomarinimicrobiota bacterium]